MEGIGRNENSCIEPSTVAAGEEADLVFCKIRLLTLAATGGVMERLGWGRERVFFCYSIQSPLG
jgi:hypothetical protein